MVWIIMSASDSEMPSIRWARQQASADEDST